jgi:hypothetical protein
MKETALQAITRMAESMADAALHGTEDTPIITYMDQMNVDPSQVHRQIFRQYHLNMSKVYRTNTNQFYSTFVQRDGVGTDAESFKRELDRAGQASLAIIRDTYEQTYEELLTPGPVKEDVLATTASNVAKANADKLAMDAQIEASKGPSKDRELRPADQ